MVQVNWTDTALQDLNDIGDYISKDSVRYAEITVNRLFEQIIRGDYRIIYQVINELRIDILTVHHCARLITNTKDFKPKDNN